MCVRESAIAAGIPKTSLWRNVPPVALGEVLDVVCFLLYTCFNH